MPDTQPHDELSALRRKQDELLRNEVVACKHGIEKVEETVMTLKEQMTTQLLALNIQIAKIPAPLSLDALEDRFVMRREREMESSLVKDLLSTFITKEEIRSLKVAVYALWTSIGAGCVLALFTFLSRRTG